MPKVVLVLNIIQAAMSLDNDPRINAIYAQIGENSNELQQILQDQPDASDQLAKQAVLYALGAAGKPHWLEAIGL